MLLGALLLACIGSGGTIAACQSGLDISDPSHETVACSVDSNPCAYPQLLCRLPASAPVASRKCVCDPRRLNEHSPGNPKCKATGRECVASESACQRGGGTVASGVDGCSESDVCCDGFISSADDPGCAGAHKKEGSCVDADDNDLPEICCSG
jgi:hypothetical protein